jgi:D-alanyl-D-alanine carboxypeptidase
MNRLFHALAIALFGALLVGAPPSAAQTADPPPAQHASADWLRTVRAAPLWSGPDRNAVQFTTLPVGSFVHPLAGDASGRLFVYFTGDGDTRQPGPAWIAASDVGPSGPPPWVISSELDGDAAPAPPQPGAPQRVGFAAPPHVSAPQFAVVDDGTGLLLYGVNPHTPEPPASTTKIATALVAFQRMNSLDQRVHITVDGDAMAEADGSSIMGLQPGGTLSVRTLLYGLLLPSGNDAAEQLAISLAPSRADYVQAMNDEVAELGLHDTHFVNPSGLDADGHDASPYDLAELARAAMANPTFRDIVGTPSYTGDGMHLAGHNPLLGVYPGTDGVKTGTTDGAGKVLVASATHDGHRVYVVIMHSDDLVADSEALYDWVWQTFAW